MTKFPIQGLLLQGDVDAAGYTINNLNKSGLLLVKADVGLGNVDNTSDALKPLSLATVTALAGKEANIPYGTTSQYWRGDKTWALLGALGTQDGITSLPTLSSIALTPTATAVVRANRSDAAASTSIRHTGASAIGTILPGINLANAGALAFDGCSVGVIKTNNDAPLIFGINNAARMRLELGLNVGMAAFPTTDIIDPGAGCIWAFGTIRAGVALVSDASITAATSVTAATGVITAITASTITTALLACTGNSVSFSALPTSDPLVAGRLWRSTNDLKISTGP